MDDLKDDIELYDEDDAPSSSEYSVSTTSSKAEDASDSEYYSEAEEDNQTTTGIENEIEGDFDRLINTIRASDGGPGPGMLSKVWDLKLEDNPADWRDSLREASGIGRRKIKKRERRVGPVLSQQVRALIGEGNQAYVDNNVPEAIRIMQEVIRIEPRAVSAWSVLAQCQADGNEPVKALQLRVMAAHLTHDPDEWYSLATQSRSLGYSHQALYCYGKVYHLDPTNVDALWDRAVLAKEMDQLRTARHALLAILKQIPHDLTILEELRSILIELSDITLCATLFQQAFENYSNLYPEGKAVDPETNKDIPGGGFGLMELLVLADLYNSTSEHEKAVDSIRRGCRWLQGRSAQRYWDNCEDDREYDIPVDQGGAALVREGVLASGSYPLDVNARHRLAVARIKMGDLEEGKMHADVVLAQEVLDYSPLFVEIADAYFEKDMYSDAVQIYETLAGDPGTSSFHVLLQAAACRRLKGDLKEAAEIYEHVITSDPSHKDAKMKLAEIYEILDEPRKALELVTQVINSRKRKKSGAARQESVIDQPSQHDSLFEEKVRGSKDQKPPKPSRQVTRELEAQKTMEVKQGYHRLEELREQMLAGEEAAITEWLMEAEKLVETFRETRRLFLSTRLQGFRGIFRGAGRKKTSELNADDMASRLQLEIDRDKSSGSSRAQNLIDIFRGVSFNDWLRIIIQYAFLIAQRGQDEDAEEVLRHIMCSNAYQTDSAQDTLRYAIMACAIHGGRHHVVVEQARKMINVHQFNNEPIRILLAGLASGLHQTDSFIASPFQKHMLREVKFADLAARNKDQMRWNPRTRRFGIIGGGKVVDEDEDEAGEETIVGEDNQPVSDIPKAPSKQNPVILTLYGQFCVTAKSYQSAIFYLLQSYELCPTDPVICLCLAISSVGRAMQRQADNRHHLITQALAFLSQYRRVFTGDERAMQEVEYNFGRLFHQLGLFSHAARHYERVLEMAETRSKQDPKDVGVAKEAAYNLSLIYVMTGAGSLAKKLYRRWLSL